MSKFKIASLNFVDLGKNSGPAINEVEFNGWLLRNFAEVLVLTPRNTGRISSGGEGCVRAIGAMSLKNFPLFVYRQIMVLLMLVRELDVGAIFYYRHSRLSFVAYLLKFFRHDIRLVVHRAHPFGSDALVGRSKMRRLVASAIEYFDFRLRIAVFRRAEWVDCVNMQQAIALKEEAGVDIHVVMNGVNVSQFSSIANRVRDSVRSRYGLPHECVVIGYCGGFPIQRGARQIRALLELNEAMWGVVIGKLSSDEAQELLHPRLLLLGEMQYEDVPNHVAVFDIVVAFDLPERSAIVGNSNQKIRQGLASGAWVLTSNSDIDLDGRPWLGKDVDSRDLAAQQQAIITAAPYLQQRQRRIDFARLELDIDAIFSRRHAAIISGCHRHV